MKDEIFLPLDKAEKGSGPYETLTGMTGNGVGLTNRKIVRLQL